MFGKIICWPLNGGKKTCKEEHTCDSKKVAVAVE